MILTVISSQAFIKNEAILLNALLDRGLEYLHIRKPHSSIFDFETLIKQINSVYHDRLIIHQHFELFSRYNFRGIHYNPTKGLINENPFKNKHISYSLHFFDEILNYQKNANYVFLSPIFNSISKKSHLSSFNELEIKNFFIDNELETKVIALGGINKNNFKNAIKMGFNGIALLGCLWEDTKYTIENFEYFLNEM